MFTTEKFDIVESYEKDGRYYIKTDGYGTIDTGDKEQWEKAVKDGYVEIDIAQTYGMYGV
ncbi:MAG: hypothetical protein N3I35_06645 [Clostridia bacterium]|nr:hypothetical protein [Clostridia bacterium]